MYNHIKILVRDFIYYKEVFSKEMFKFLCWKMENLGSNPIRCSFPDNCPIDRYKLLLHCCQTQGSNLLPICVCVRR